MSNKTSILEKRLKDTNLVLITFLSSLLIAIIIFSVMGITPFGNKSFATMDARIQYLDFFAYYKDVLNGDAGLLYSFTKMLGSNGVADFSYYLASPLNLIVVLFDKSNLNDFFSTLVIIKISLSCAFFALYINYRWKDIGSIVAILLAFGYGFSQYSAAQASNIMWLDGVFMLPLLLLSLCKLLDGKGYIQLVLFVAINIIISWYTAYFNLLFVFIYLVFETIYRNSFNSSIVKKYLLVFYSVSIGVGLGMFLFLPTLMALSSGKGKIEWELFKLGFNGNITTFLSNYYHGAMSSRGNPALYCGAIVIPLIISYMFFSKIKKHKRMASIFILALTILSLYFIPLEFIFNEFRGVFSYNYRYSYLSTFSLLLIVVCALSEKDTGSNIIKSCLIFSGIILLISANKTNNLDGLYATISISLLLCVLISFLLKNKYSNSSNKIFTVLFALVFVFDISNNFINVSSNIGFYSSSDYSSYVKNQSSIISSIKHRDNSLYRIVNQEPRTESPNKLNPNNNEPSAFNYMGISSYSSSYSSNQTNILNMLGYATKSVFTNIDTRIPSSDSLLGVKYIVSTKRLENLELDFKSGGRYIYRNPNFIPFGIVYNGSIDGHTKFNTTNPFVFQNQLFSLLSGEDLVLFKEINAHKEINGGNVKFRLSPVKGGDDIYGYIDTFKNWLIYGNVHANGNLITPYSDRLAPKLFHAGKSNGEKFEVELINPKNTRDVRDGHFAIFDHKKFSDVAKKIASNKADISIKNSTIHITAEATNNNQSLFLPIALDDGWTVNINGENVIVKNILGNIASIPLHEGKNKIMLTFTPPGMRAGIIISLLALIILISVITYRKLK